MSESDCDFRKFHCVTALWGLCLRLYSRCGPGLGPVACMYVCQGWLERSPLVSLCQWPGLRSGGIFHARLTWRSQQLPHCEAHILHIHASQILAMSNFQVNKKYLGWNSELQGWCMSCSGSSGLHDLAPKQGCGQFVWTVV